MRIAYFDCFAGISGDMTLGALVDAGASFDSLKSELYKLGLHGYEISSEKVNKRGISATSVIVEVHDSDHHHTHSSSSHTSSHQTKGIHVSRGFSEIRRMIEESELADRVKKQAVAIFRRLGEAEAKVHGKDIEEIHFHEVGAVDSIVDIVGACICLDLLNIDSVHASPIPTFTGMVEMAHGLLPLPAPATVELLKNVPWRKLGIEGEIVTPTGAAILAELSSGFGAMPQMLISSTGYGAGKKDFGMPNVLRVIIGEAEEQPIHSHEDVAVIEANIDDLSPQIYEVVMERLFARGALDVYMTPIQMKKNRPAVLLSVICKPSDTSQMTDVLFCETSTIGVRIDIRSRMCLAREIVAVQTPYGEIRLKIAKRNGQVVNAHPEYEDCKSAATSSGVPIKLVNDAAISAFYNS